MAGEPGQSGTCFSGKPAGTMPPTAWFLFLLIPPLITAGILKLENPLLPLVFVAAVIVAIPLFLYPVSIFVLIALLLPWEGFQMLPGSNIGLTKVLGAFCLGAGLLHFLSGRIEDIRPTPANIPAVLFLVFAALSFPQSNTPDESMVALFSISSYLVLALLGASLLRKESHVLAVCLAFWFSILAISTLISLEALGVSLLPSTLNRITHVGGEAVGRYAGGSDNPAIFVMFPLFGLGISVGLLQAIRGRVFRLLLLGSAAIFVLTIYLSYTRSALIAAGILLLVNAMIFTKNRIIWSSCVIAMLLVGALMLPGYVISHYIGAFTMEESSAFMRVKQFQAAAELARQHWLFGLGISSSSDEVRAYNVNFDLVGNTVHNTPINIFLQTGLFGLLAFVGIWSMGFFRVWRETLLSTNVSSRAIMVAILLAFTAYLAHNMMHPLPYTSAVGLLGAVGSASWNISRARRAAESP